MKIGTIKRNGDIFIITFIPNKIEKFFGKIECTKEFRKSNDVKWKYGGDIFYSKTGERVEMESSIIEL